MDREIIDPRTGDKFIISTKLPDDTGLVPLIYEKRDFVLEIRALLKCLRLIRYEIPEFGVPTSIASYISGLNYKTNYWNQMAMTFDFMTANKELRFFSHEQCKDVVWKSLTSENKIDYISEVKEREEIERKENEKIKKWVPAAEYFADEMLAINADINENQELEMLELLCENVGDPRQIIWSFAFNERMINVIKHDRFWTLWNRYFDHPKYKSYMLRYVFYILLFEERIRYSNMTVSCRNIFKLEDGHLLSKQISVGIETMTHPFIFIADPFFNNLSFYTGANGRAIVTRPEFERRLNYMVPFLRESKLVLANYNACISGSVLLPCISDVPQQALFNSWEEFTQYYYSDSDIDISIHVDQQEEYYEVAERFIRDLTAEMRTYNIAVGYEKVERQNGYKYCLKFVSPNPGDQIKYRSIDLFHSRRDPVRLTKMYHLAVVRSFYDGLNVWIHSSAIVSILSGLNYNFRYTTVVAQSLGNVILKYANRGFATNVTKTESTLLLSYLKKSPEWSNIACDTMGYVTTNHPFFYKNGLPPRFVGSLNRDIITWNKSLKHTRFGKIIPPMTDYTDIESAFC